MSFLLGPKVEEADVRKVVEALPQDGAVLVDVREPHEWRAGHAPQARHIPLQPLPPFNICTSRDDNPARRGPLAGHQLALTL